MKHFDSILVANRGEIAVRVIRSAQQQGYRAIAVYSEADAGAPHVQMADEAVLIGAAPIKESYLDADKILEAARKTGAQAIHPGYGFLSESAEFSSACEADGIIFIGPSPEAIEIMGNKAASKRRMLEAGVPCIPGFTPKEQDKGKGQPDEIFISAAREIGVPVMVKAAAGGGGRGMRLVEDMNDLPVALSSARSEAENIFGSDELILEKAVIQPRHVEIQVFGDSQGNVIHLGERDCSVQRRHQKVVEESPCPIMTPKLREAMGLAAVNAAKSINYVGAGTVEFLLDANNNFYFLEMNTRLQVEHPVTEMVTGQDLVAMQFHVSQGYPLPLQQTDVSLTGHAIEVRLYAEDTTNDFLPATGIAHTWHVPQGEGVRVDHGLLTKQEISPFYDPMIAKIIAWGEDRDIARRRLLRALQNTCLLGVETNREFLIDVLQKDAFAEGQATTAFIDENYNLADLQPDKPSSEHLMVAACTQYRKAQEQFVAAAIATNDQLTGFRSDNPVDTHFCYGEGEKMHDVTVREIGSGHYQVSINGESHRLQWLHEQEGQARLLVDNVQKTVHYAILGRGEIAVQSNGIAHQFTNQFAFTKGDEDVGGSGIVIAPMHGSVLEISVTVGDSVEEGQTLAVMEAMKMEHRLDAQVSGVVSAIHVSGGDQVASGALMLEIAED